MRFHIYEIMDNYHQKMHKQAQNARLIKQARPSRTAIQDRMFLNLGDTLISLGSRVKNMSQAAPDHNGVTIHYEMTQ